MELYRISRADFKIIPKFARKVSEITGKSFLYHWFDCLYGNIRYGCNPVQYLEGGFYKLRSIDREKTYTKYRGYKLKRIFNNPDYCHICENKVDFNTVFSKYLGRNWIYCKVASRNEILSFLSNNGNLLAKPVNLTKGEGIFELDRSLSDEDLADSVYGKDLILEEIIVQHPQMCFGNKSVNTLRVNSVLDNGGMVHIIKTSLRCGIGDSIVDNYSAGGVVYPVNSKYGRVEGPGANSTRGQEIFIHPGTEMFMIGLEIPFWSQVEELICNAARLIPQVRFVGWDVAITKDGPVLVEGNTRPGAQLIEYQGFDKGLYKKILSYR